MNGHKTFHQWLIYNKFTKNFSFRNYGQMPIGLFRLDNITNYISEHIFYTFLKNNLLCFSCKCSKRFGLYIEA